MLLGPWEWGGERKIQEDNDNDVQMKHETQLVHVNMLNYEFFFFFWEGVQLWVKNLKRDIFLKRKKNITFQ